MSSIRNATIEDYRALYTGDYMIAKERERSRDVEEAVIWLSPCRVLEVGCGHGRMVDRLQAIGIDAYGYDPAAPRRSPYILGGPDLPDLASFDLICSCDVLEHIGRTDVENLIARTSGAAAQIHAIHTGPDVHLIGGQAVELHLTRKPEDWWRRLFARHYGHAATVRASFAPNCRFTLEAWK